MLMSHGSHITDHKLISQTIKRISKMWEMEMEDEDEDRFDGLEFNSDVSSVQEWSEGGDESFDEIDDG